LSIAYTFKVSLSATPLEYPSNKSCGLYAHVRASKAIRAEAFELKDGLKAKRARKAFPLALPQLRVADAKAISFSPPENDKKMNRLMYMTDQTIFQKGKR
jgi:hypothetical protein